MSDRDPASDRVAAPTPGARAARAREIVRSALADCIGALGAWEAGSAAFGRADDSSDLDIGVLCIRDAGGHVLDSIEQGLAADGDELVRWDVGRSVFGVQRFWRPAREVDVATCMVDVSVIELEREREEWSELLLPERHGRALGLHDVDGTLQRARGEACFDVDVHRARIARELATIRDRRAMFADFPAKEVARGRSLDAHGMHQMSVGTPLVTLLGMRWRPLRFDFTRYLHDELPEDVAARLGPILRPGYGDDVLAASAEGRAWIDELLDELDPAALPIEAHAASMREAFG